MNQDDCSLAKAVFPSLCILDDDDDDGITSTDGFLFGSAENWLAFRRQVFYFLMQDGTIRPDDGGSKDDALLCEPPTSRLTQTIQSLDDKSRITLLLEIRVEQCMDGANEILNMIGEGQSADFQRHLGQSRELVIHLMPVPWTRDPT